MDHVIISQAIFTTYDGVLTLDGIKCQHYFYSRSAFYQSLVPVKQVLDIADRLREEYFSGKVVVGVHYRAHDAVFDWGELFQT